MLKFLLVMLGGGLGSTLRFGISAIGISRTFPWATWVVNMLGCLAIGLVMGWIARNPQQDNWRLFLATGLCGGFTTFSAFGWENLQLLQQGKTALAALYILMSVVLGILAVFLGYKLINNI